MGLGALQTVSGSVTIENNPALASFQGLSSFDEIGGDLRIANNPSLSNATAQGFANALTVHGTTTINE